MQVLSSLGEPGLGAQYSIRIQAGSGHPTTMYHYASSLYESPMGMILPQSLRDIARWLKKFLVAMIVGGIAVISILWMETS